MRIEKAVAIRRPVEEVWSLIADLRNDPRWCDKVESVEQVAGDGPGEDARYRVLHRPVPLRAAKPLAVRQIDEIEWKLRPPRGPSGGCW